MQGRLCAACGREQRLYAFYRDGPVNRVWAVAVFPNYPTLAEGYLYACYRSQVHKWLRNYQPIRCTLAPVDEAVSATSEGRES